MIKKNMCFDVLIEKDSGNGSGICYIDNMTVFVLETTKGDRAKIKIVGTKPSYATAKVEELIDPSKNRRTDFCKHAGDCGGCDFAHVSYERQLEIKKEHVISCITRIGKVSEESVEFFDTLGMENPSHYRNKMVFPVAKAKGGKVIGGFYKRKSHDVTELLNCSQGDEICIDYLKAVVDFMNDFAISAYDEKTHKGVVRRVFVRLGRMSKEAMVVISCATDKIKYQDELVSRLQEVKSEKYELKSIILNINKQKNNLVLGDKNITLFGNDTIKDSICGITFTVSPNSFFQVNPVQTEVLYSKAIEFAELSKDKTAIDLYCGAGTVTLAAAKHAKKVIGVEIVEAAVKNAKDNAKLNKIENAEFILGSAESVSEELAKKGTKADVVFIDPPRKGSDEITLNAICSMQPEKIVYISCNPATLARDILFLEEKGYKTRKVQPVDMFPNTTHVETVVLLSKVQK